MGSESQTGLPGRFRRLGGSGLLVPPMAVGTQAWGEKGWGYGSRYSQDDLYAAYRAALDHGMNFLDTSDSYGASEDLIGQFRHRDGREVILATKFSPSIFFDKSERVSPKHVAPTLDESLRRLRVDCIDLYQMHYPVSEPRLDDFLAEFVRAVKAGKVKAVGVSNFNLAQMRRAHQFFADHNIALALNQIGYSLLYRMPEWNGMLDACEKLDIAIIALMPLLQGILTGKYRPGGPDLPTNVKIVMRVIQFDPFKESYPRRPLLSRLFSKPLPMRRKTLEPLFEVMSDIAKKHDATIAQVALNWLLGSSERVVPIVGAKNPRQSEDNARTLTWQLTLDEWQMITAAEQCVRGQARLGN